jgi:hypothetical protein
MTYLVKRRSTTQENKKFKWVPCHNHDGPSVVALACSNGAFPFPKTEGDYIAILTIVDVCLDDGEFWEFGDYLVYRN